MTLSPWFERAKHGLPRRTVKYDFEIWIEPENGKLCAVLTVRAHYKCGRNYIKLKGGRVIQLTHGDSWRGVMK